MKKRVSFAAGILISVLFIYLAFRKIDFSLVVAAYKKSNPLWTFPFAAVMLVELAFRAARWRLILAPVKKTDLWTVFKLEAIGLAVNNILPFRLGEAVRGAMAAKVFGISYVAAFSTIVVERFLDTLVLILMFSFFSRYGNITGGLGNYGNFFTGLVVFITLALLVFIFADRVSRIPAAASFLSKNPGLAASVEKVASGVRCFHSPVPALLIILFGFSQWFMDALNNYFMAFSFGIADTVDFFRSVALLFTGAVAVSVPSMPGYFGNFEFAYSRVMALWGISGETALAYAGTVHILSYLLITALGVFFIYSMGHNPAQIFRAAKGGKDERD